MKVAVLAFALFAVVVSANINAHLTAVGRVRGADKEWSRFVKFVRDHKRAYTSVAETNAKFDIFRDNMKINAERQKRNPLARFGPTKFSDISQQEFEATYLMSRDTAQHMRNEITEARKTRHVHIPRNFTPNDIDWCAKGMCTAVKDQQQCGSCWAFSATETFESALIQAGKGSPDQMVLGPQQIVSCDTAGQDQGCQGGMPSGAITYLQSAGGQCGESQYPYSSGGGDSGSCSLQGSSCPDGSAFLSGGAPSGYTPTESGDQGLQAALAGSVVSVGVDASQWNGYTGGILTDCGSQLDHAVVATGLGTDPSAGVYYIVRNSWGAGWGENGFIFIGGSGDVCGIADNAITVQA